MFLRSFLFSGAALLLCSGALAQDAHVDFSKRVQERLQLLGFYQGPINGDIGPHTQAALAQFQLSIPVPASGQLDEPTVAALGLERHEPQSAEAGATAQPADEAARQ